MPGFVHSGAHQIIHRGIDDCKIFIAAVLKVLDFGDENPSITYDRATWLKQYRNRFAVVARCAPAIDTLKKAG
jgi:hypothetical protein